MFYSIWSPDGQTNLVTTNMGEADFWASLGYVVLDYFAPVQVIV